MTIDQLDAYAERLGREVLEKVEAEGGALRDAFAARVLDMLEEGGYIANHTIAWYDSRRGTRLHGFGYADDNTVLELYTTIFEYERPTLNKTEIERTLRQAVAFLGQIDSIRAASDPHTAIHQMCDGVQRILRNPDGVDKIKVFLLTNRQSGARSMPTGGDFEGIPIEYHLWDLPKLERQESSGDLGEPITVEFDPPLRCLSAQTGDSHSVVLAVVPGRRLAELYDEYRTRLLQLNVRAFLQVRGKVNKGIRVTALDEPEWFLAYNNGITATASEADFIHDNAGVRVAIRSLTGVQIVNGGQTTATLHHVFKRDKSELAGIDVQMKLTLVDPDALDTVVPRISEYSNSQNKVGQVDFSSNDRFHVDFEKVSRTVWAPPHPGALHQTRWFYVRTRGSYEAELDKHLTTATRKRFREQNPKNQAFTKTDLAKYVNAWSGLPHLVSRGAQKNFAEFQARITEQAPRIDDVYCRRVVALKILFHAVDGVARELGAGSNKSAITAYTFALLCRATDHRIDLDRIWREQRITDVLRDSITELCGRVMKVVIREGVHVIEWAKKEDCWTEVSQIVWDTPESLGSELRSTSLELNRSDVAAFEEQTSRFNEIDPETWDAVLEWAQEAGRLEPHEQQTVAAARTAVDLGEPLAPAKLRRVLDVYERALEAGFAVSVE